MSYVERAADFRRKISLPFSGLKAKEIKSFKEAAGCAA
jgi:hypothetical protein